MRKKRVVQAGKCYHLVSRVAHRAFFFDDDEKDRFVDLLMRVEFFSCVRVLSYCCMSNHIHVFIYLDDARELSLEEGNGETEYFNDDCSLIEYVHDHFDSTVGTFEQTEKALQAFGERDNLANLTEIHYNTEYELLP